MHFTCSDFHFHPTCTYVCSDSAFTTLLRSVQQPSGQPFFFCTLALCFNVCSDCASVTVCIMDVPLDPGSPDDQNGQQTTSDEARVHYRCSRTHGCGNTKRAHCFSDAQRRKQFLKGNFRLNQTRKVSRLCLDCESNQEANVLLRAPENKRKLALQDVPVVEDDSDNECSRENKRLKSSATHAACNRASGCGKYLPADSFSAFMFRLRVPIGRALRPGEQRRLCLSCEARGVSSTVVLSSTKYASVATPTMSAKVCSSGHQKKQLSSRSVLCSKVGGCGRTLSPSHFSPQQLEKVVPFGSTPRDVSQMRLCRACESKVEQRRVPQPSSTVSSSPPRTSPPRLIVIPVVKTPATSDAAPDAAPVASSASALRPPSSTAPLHQALGDISVRMEDMSSGRKLTISLQSAEANATNLLPQMIRTYFQS